MKKHPVLIIFFISIILTLCHSEARRIYANSLQVSDIHESFYIGEIINIEIDLSQIKPERPFVQREYGDKPVMVLDLNEIKDKPWHYLLRIAAFDTGYVNTDRIPIYSLTQGQPDTIFVEPFNLFIKSSLTEADSLLKDIMPPVDFKLKFLDYFVPILVLLIIAAIFYFLNKFKHKTKEVEKIVVDNRPAWMIALELLDILKKKRLLEDGLYLDFYFELSMILRIFIEKQYGIKAAEMTTYEIKQVFPNIPAKKQIINVLTDMDRTKFAKFTPDFTEAKETLIWIENYIRSFAREEVASEELQDTSYKLQVDSSQAQNDKEVAQNDKPCHVEERNNSVDSSQAQNDKPCHVEERNISVDSSQAQNDKPCHVEERNITVDSSQAQNDKEVAQNDTNEGEK